MNPIASRSQHSQKVFWVALYPRTQKRIPKPFRQSLKVPNFIKTKSGFPALNINCFLMKNRLALILLIVLLPFVGLAQDDSGNRTPYELMSTYYAEQFKPFQKKNVYTGLAFSLSDKNLSNVDQLTRNVVEGKDKAFSIIVKGGYYTGDYAMVGLNFEYAQQSFEGTLLRDNDTVQSNSISRSYNFTPNVRSTVPLTKTERLSFFTEVGLSFGVGNTLTRNVKNLDEIETSYADDFNFRVGISPGITFFAIENFAFEVQLDVLGYELNVKNREVNGEDQSRIVTNNIDFNIDLLSLKLGLAYYFGASKKRK